LDGKTVYYFGQASTPQYIIEHLLKKNNVNATLVPVADGAELATLMASGTPEEIAACPDSYTGQYLKKWLVR
jgi:excinuclease UvrABC ATPase subunit